MSTLSQLPPTPTPEPEEPKSPPKAQRKLLPPIVRAVWRPILALAIVAHAFLLFIPLQKPKPKPLPTPSPIDKNVKIDRVSLIKKAAPAPQAKPRPRTNRRPRTNVKPAVRPRTAPAPRQSPQPRDEPPPDDSTQEPLSSPGPGSPAPDPGSGTDSSIDMCGLGDVLDTLRSNEPGEILPSDIFKNPELYYESGSLKSIVGDMVRVNRYKRGESEGRDYNSIQDRLGNACKNRGATFERQQQLGDGELFVLTKGSTRAYISLVRTGTPVDPITIVVAWNGDPTKP